MTPTMKLRHVWREINDGNGDLKVLATQQWWAESEVSLGWAIINPSNKGEWRDVEVEEETT